jgi:hypothetical protein
MRSILFVLLILFSIQQVDAGGPWTNGKKKGFFQLQATIPLGTYNLLFLEDGSDLELNRGVTDFHLQAYLEYGFTDNLSLTGSLPYKFVATNDEINPAADLPLLPSGKLNGIGNIELALKYKFFDKSFVAATSIKAELNSISRDMEKGLATGYGANGIGIYGHLGKGLNRFYTFVEGGYMFKDHNYSDEVRINFEAGYKAVDELWLALVFDIRESMKNGNFDEMNLIQTGLYPNNQEYFAFGFKTFYEFKNKIGLSASTFGAFGGNYAAHLATINIGVFKKW